MYIYLVRWAAACAAILLIASGQVSANGLPEKKQTKAGLYLTAFQAAAMLEDPSVVFVDVRTRSEVAFVGMPSRVNVHIPFKVMPDMPVYDPEKGGYTLEENPEFGAAFIDYAKKHGVGENTKIVLICRSGSRSAKAADVLYDFGFKTVYSVADGFEGDTAKDGPASGQRVVNGWRNAGLTWGYGIRPDQAYPKDQM